METFLTILLLVALIILLVFIMCHILGHRAKSWFRTNPEEKIGFSNHTIFNPNGYLMQSNSEILLGSRGSFKRFDSVDRDAQQNYGQTGIVSPFWNTAPDTFGIKIPPQPTRQPPRPPITTGRSLEERLYRKQDSLNYSPRTPLTAPVNSMSAIPRPVPKKQMSAPVTHMSIPPLTPPVSAASKKSPRKQVVQKQSTNPFYDDSIELDLMSMEQLTDSKSSGKNPFIEDHDDIFSFDPQKIQNLIDEANDPLKQVEARISKLESLRRMSATYRKVDEKTDNFEVPLDKRLSTSNYHLSNNTVDRYKTKTELLNHIKQMSSSLDSTIEGLTNSLKHLDSVGLESTDQNYHHPTLRNRSMSETRVEEISSVLSNPQDTTDLNNTNNNPFYPVPDQSTILHKTASDMYLEQYSLSGITRSGKNFNLAQQAGNETQSLIRNIENTKQLIKENSFAKSINHSNNTLSNGDTNNLSALKRAVSCDSVSSESSVVLGDLEQIRPPITGGLCVGLQYDKNNATQEGCELFLTVLEAKDLISHEATDGMDTFVRIYLVPDEKPNYGPLQTKVFKNSRCPSYQETFSFWINKTTNKHVKRSLWFHLYHTSTRAHTLIGEAELKLTETSRPITVWLQLSDSRHNHYNWGELMFSLSYLPTAERLTVVVVKARSLRIPSLDKVSASADLQNVFVKVYLLKNDRKVCKKKTTIKRGERCPIYNEAMIFSVPPYMLNSIQVRLTVVNATDGPNGRANAVVIPIGHVIVGSGTSGKGLRHWHQMLTTSLRKPVAMWHALRITHNREKKTSHYKQ